MDDPSVLDQLTDDIYAVYAIYFIYVPGMLCIPGISGGNPSGTLRCAPPSMFQHDIFKNSGLFGAVLHNCCIVLFVICEIA